MANLASFNKLYALTGAIDDSSDSGFEDAPKKVVRKKKSESKEDFKPSKEKPEKKEADEKYKKTAIPKAIKQLVWNVHIGDTVAKAKCYCCKSTEIMNVSFHCGHVIPESKGGTLDISNLRPICSLCNSSMGSRHMHEFMKTFGLKY